MDQNGVHSIGSIPELKSALALGLLFRSSSILKEFILELRSIATLNSKGKGILDVGACLRLFRDREFLRNAKTAFAVEYALREYCDISDGEDEAIALRQPFQRDISMYDDVKRCLFELARGSMKDAEFSKELDQILMSALGHRERVANIGKVIAAFPDRPNVEAYQKVFDACMQAVHIKWPTLDTSGLNPSFWTRCPNFRRS